MDHGIRHTLTRTEKKMRDGIYIDTSGPQICQSSGEAGLHHYRQGLNGYKVHNQVVAMEICQELILAWNARGKTQIPALKRVEMAKGRASVQATYYRRTMKIVMNSKEVATLLHELAHHIADYTSPGCKAHGREFKACLRWVYMAAEETLGIEIHSLAQKAAQAKGSEALLAPGTRVKCGARTFTVVKMRRTRYELREEGAGGQLCSAPRSILEVI